MTESESGNQTAMDIKADPPIIEAPSQIEAAATYHLGNRLFVHAIEKLPNGDYMAYLGVVRPYDTSAASQLPCPTRADALVEGGACTPTRRVGLTRSKSACGAGPDASGNLIVGVLHSIPGRHRGAERRGASRSLRRTRLRGRLTATRPCRETHRGLGGTPALTDCLWPVMDSQQFVAPGNKGSHALLPSLLAPFGRSLRKGTPRYRLVEAHRQREDRQRVARAARSAARAAEKTDGTGLPVEETAGDYVVRVERLEGDDAE